MHNDVFVKLERINNATLSWEGSSPDYVVGVRYLPRDEIPRVVELTVAGKTESRNGELDLEKVDTYRAATKTFELLFALRRSLEE